MGAQTVAKRQRTGAKATGIILPAILAELERQGHTKFWLAAQIGVAPNAIYALLKRDFRLKHADKMLAALGLEILPRH